MPFAPPRPCSVPTCGALNCEVHKRQAWQPSAPVTRIRGRKLQRLREQMHAAEPWCRMCKRVITLQEMVRDHIINLQSPGGTDTEDNTQPLCPECHDTKTAAEAQRGKNRAQLPKR